MIQKISANIFEKRHINFSFLPIKGLSILNVAVNVLFDTSSTFKMKRTFKVRKFEIIFLMARVITRRARFIGAALRGTGGSWCGRWVGQAFRGANRAWFRQGVVQTEHCVGRAWDSQSMAQVVEKFSTCWKTSH
jgi:hypothetical protein